MVTEILCGVSGVAIGYIGYLIATLKAAKKENQHDRLYDNLHTKYTNLVSEDVQLQADYKQLKADFQQLAEEHAARKEANSKLAAGNNAIAKEYHDLKAKYETLKENHAPFAALNPFEAQAMHAMASQSVVDEWLNGEKEVK
ncbi:hypothetical protein AVT25_gp03 [Bacillus phage Pavlov]|uniref:Uncharacterized protein n=2 Tax=Pagevirus TaxID=1921184 RepID=A0A0A0RVG5_9CAUD|nr:hypothetical protein Pony_3 [Bacillus phage Pony]YP_009152802.1 hypothetical protein CPT_Pookie3 [Bacillus phage Pookie]YP_009197472.1 hypothetical protein AVT25_gp03 [Bacillus phage Pavlov]AGY48244.1 hypothetical protein Pony_3 [Bacillus phage Pony]AIW03688.1 hypothetical protein CPT_Pookie3 [Bacillus phage Pookie]AKQ07424.1 hypothetical protein CPT_Pavlov3 [Bacillus phage Pavlov]